MNTPLRVLILEDNPDDAELVVLQLRRDGFDPLWQRVETEADFVAGLDENPEIILADYSLPEFSAPRAFELLKNSGLNIPFIVVSGTIGDEQALECMKQGAADFVLKDRPGRLGISVKGALEQKRLREEARLADEARRESDERLRLLAENTDDFYLINHVDGRRLYVSPSFYRSTGWTPDEFLTADWHKFVHADDVALVEAKRAANLRGEETEAETRVLCKDGSYLWAHYRCKPIRGADGQVERMLIWSRDITKRVQAEAALRDKEHLLSEAQRIAQIGSWDWDMTGPIQWSDETYRIYGLSPETFTPTIEALVKLIHPEDRPAMQEWMRACMAGEKPGELEVRCVWPDGTVRFLSGRGELICDAKNKPVHMSGTVQDITVRKQAEQLLRVSDARYRSYVEVTGQIGWVTNAAGEVQEDVPSLRKYTGQTYEEAKGFGWANALHPDDLEHTLQVWREAVTTKVSYEVEYRLRRHDGVYHHFLARGFPALHEDGSIREWVGTCIDITERKRAEEDLRASEVDFRNLAEAMPQIVWTTRPDGWNTYFNQRWVDYTGMSLEESYGHGWNKPFHPDDHQRAWDAWQNAVQNNATYSLECRLRRADGTYFWWLVRGVPQLDENGKILKWFGTCTDIDEIKRTEQSYSRLAAVVEQAAETVVITDTEGTILYANPAFEKSTGYTRAEALGQNPRLLKSGKQDAAYYRQMWETLQPGDVWFGHFTNKRKDGTLYEEDDAISPVKDASGKVVNYAAVKHDVTERIHAEQALNVAYDTLEDRVVLRTGELAQANTELQAARKQADAANHAKSEFLSRMSHELRTPLNAILGFGQILEMHDLGTTKNEGVGHILKGGRHLLELINEILEISRIEAGRIHLSMEPIAAQQVLAEALDMVGPIAKKYEVTLAAQAENIGHFHVLADRQKLTQVLINLISNAVKYNRPGGSVTTRCRLLDDHRLRMEVSDTGLGLTADEIKRLFVPFERLDADKTGVEGTGLGLTLSHHLIEAMGGSIGVESVKGEGCTFYLDLPVVDSPMEVNGLADISAPSQLEPPHKTSTVLCIEDNLSNYSLIEAILSDRPGIKLIGAMQGSIGLDLARLHRPDLILLDIHLPDINGDEVLRQLRLHPETAHIPVVIVSADATTLQIERLMAAGANAYLTKPLNLKEFLKVLDEQLLKGH